MSNDHQHNTPPPTAAAAATTEHHRQPFSSTPNSLPNTPSPMKPNPSEPNSTPESRLAAALGRAFFNIPPSSFPSTTPLLRTLSDADSSVTTTTTTPPKIPSNTPLRRTLSESISPPDYDHTLHINSNNNSKNPLRRTLSDTSDCQVPHKTPRVSSSPHSSTGKQSPQSEVVVRKIEDMVREIGQRCWEIMRQEEQEQHVKDEIPETEGKEGEEECVGVERLKNGDMRFELGCSCGKRFEMLIKHNGYCFYRLT